MVDFIHWPTKLLRPASAIASPVAFTRSGGRSLGGIERATRTDRGFWRLTLNDVTIHKPAMRRTWNAIRTQLGGRAGIVAVPAWSIDSAPYVSSERDPLALTTHDDGTKFDDGAAYSQGAIDIQMASYAPLGSTVVTLRLVHAASGSGIRFSYQHALYETGAVLSEPGEGLVQVSVFPSIRAAIPAGAQLEVERPTCLCRLADDRGMDLPLTAAQIDAATVEFVEAVDVWNALALEVA